MGKQFHKQVWSNIIGAEVDEGILELIEWLNKVGIKTKFSCQGRYPDLDYPEGTNAYVCTEASAFPKVFELFQTTPEFIWIIIPSSAAVRGEEPGSLVFQIRKEDLEEVSQRWMSMDVADFAPEPA